MSLSPSKTPFESAFLQCGFILGYLTKTDVERWAEKQIEKTEQPSLEMIELATLRGKHDWDIVSLLSHVESEVEPRERMKISIGIIGKMFQTGRLSLESAVRALFWMLNKDAYKPSQEEESEIYCLDDGYDLAVNGTYGSIKEVTNHFVEFTRPYVSVVDDIESAIAETGC